MKNISNIVHIATLKRCSSGKHKLRENELGVVWCVYCGLLPIAVGNMQKLTEEDKIQIYVHKEKEINI